MSWTYNILVYILYSPYLKKIFQGIPWVSGFFSADHFVWNLFGSRKRYRVHWGFGGFFFSWGIAYVSGPCGIFLFLGVSPGLLAARPCWQAVSEKPVFGSCILDFVTVFRAAALPKGGVVLILDSGSWIFGCGLWVFYFGFWILDFWDLEFLFWILDLGFLGFGVLILDSGSWILGFGFWSFDFGFWILHFGGLDFGVLGLDSGFWDLDFEVWILEFLIDKSSPST